MQLSNNPSQSPETFCNFVEVHAAQRFDLRFLRRFRAGLSIRKSSSFLPPLIRSNKPTSRPAQASPDGPRYFGGTFLPRNALPPLQPTKAIALSILSNCFSISARCSRSISSTRFRRSMARPPRRRSSRPAIEAPRGILDCSRQLDASRSSPPNGHPAPR